MGTVRGGASREHRQARSTSHRLLCGLLLLCLHTSATVPAVEGATRTPIATNSDLREGQTPGCIAWRQTGACRADGPRERHNDRVCGSTIAAGVSGWCECTTGKAHAVGCEHTPFSCSNICHAQATDAHGQRDPSPATASEQDSARDQSTMPDLHSDSFCSLASASDEVLAPMECRSMRNRASHTGTMSSSGGKAPELRAGGMPVHGASAASVDAEWTTSQPFGSEKLDYSLAESEMLHSADAALWRMYLEQSALRMKSMGLAMFEKPPQVPADRQSLSRMLAVRQAFEHAWRGYSDHAWGMDELRPVSRDGGPPFLGMGLTIVDSLDTLLIMQMGSEYERARHWVERNLQFGNQTGINLFETVIRVVGGLLSAHDLSGDSMFLDRAKALTDELLFAFDTPSGIPHGTVDLVAGRKKSYNPPFLRGKSCVAEVATLQVELLYLSHRTGDERYAAAGDRIMKCIEANLPGDGLLPMFINPANGEFERSTITLGARSDSAYEYLLKQWMIVGRRGGLERRERRWVIDMFRTSIRGVLDNLVYRSSPSNLTYIVERSAGGGVKHKMDHLVCFVPGMLGLWQVARDHSEETEADIKFAKETLEVAEELMYTCFQMYNRSATGLAPEIVQFRNGGDFTTSVGAAHSLLRPETVESLFVLWRVTKNQRYRDWAWQVFSALHKHARVASGGFSGLRDVNNASRGLNDKQESFFLAETLKYLYLTFSSDDVLPLDRYVFNTEAHPLSVLR